MVSLSARSSKISERGYSYLLLVVGLVAMYLPSYIDVAKRFWGNNEETYGPVILLVVLWLLFRERATLFGSSSRAEIISGSTLLAIGLIIYVIGRSQEFFQFDIGSQPIVIMGLALSLGGRSALKRFWFPACFIIFLVPIPPSLVDQVLLPLKVTVSSVVTEALYFLGYPISRSGVVLVIGQYQLMIADACSGLRSMAALSGIGLLYVYLMGHSSRLLNGSLLVSAIPIAFLANILRVAALVLTTYYFGDDAGSQFHDIAGYFEIVLAFGCFFSLDYVFGRILRHRRAAQLA